MLRGLRCPNSRAQELVGEGQLDGAILDVNLAGQNSYLVARALQKRGVPFAFATGDSGVAPESGFESPIFLPKPFNFEGVKLVLDKLLATPRTRALSPQ